MPIPISRRALVCLGLLLAAVTVTCRNGVEQTAPPAASPPAQNLLLITIDTLRADHLSACGPPERLTPHLDSLARRGALFPRVVTPANTTLPAHASLLTSLPPEGHGGFGNGTPIHPDLDTLARACRGQGMATAAMVSSWVVGSQWNLGQGFDEYQLLYKTERRPAPPPSRRFLPLRAEDTSRAAGRWLQQHASGPFMLWLHYMDPHQAYDPPPPYHPADEVARPRTPNEFLDLFHKRQPLAPQAAAAVRTDYAGEVRYTDHCIGQLLGLLRTLGLEETTLVVVTADHGEALGRRQHYYGHSLSLGEPVNRVPLILAGPRVSPGLHREPATLLDVSPTILSLLGIEAPEAFQGRDMAPLLGRPASGPDQAGSPMAEPLLFTRSENGRRAWLVDGLKATFDPEGQITSLHRLKQDPLEQHDLLAEEPGLGRALTSRYALPYTRLATMAAERADPSPAAAADEETARRLRDLGYVEE